MPGWARKEIQSFADRKSMKKFSDALQTVYGPKSSGTTPVLSADESTLLTDKDAILKRKAEHSIVCSIAHLLSMTMPSTDCHRWSSMYCLMNSQLSLKQRKQFSICHRPRPLVRTQYLQEVNQWQRNLQSCFTACGGRRLSHKNSRMHL